MYVYVFTFNLSFTSQSNFALTVFSLSIQRASPQSTDRLANDFSRLLD